MNEVCRLLDIDKQRTTAYKASSNAAVKRFHRTLNSMMGRVVDEHQRDWDAMLPYVMAAFRSLTPDTGRQPKRSDTTAPMESEIENGMAAIAGIPPAVQRTFRTKRDVGRTRRYLD